MTVHEAVDSAPTQTQIQTLKQENLALKAEVERLHRGINNIIYGSYNIAHL